MYTTDDKSKYTVEYEDEYENYDNNNSIWNNKGLIVKIVIIIVCLAILIWLILALKKNNSTTKEVVYDPSIHANNVEKVRLAAERYFFIDKNIPDNGLSRDVTLQTLINNHYVNDITDANNKVCNSTVSHVNLDNDKNSYIMTIKLSCSTLDKEEVFNYSKINYACLNCNGQTLMDGTKQEDVKEEVKDNTNETNDKNNNSDNNSYDYSKYSCKSWTNWSATRLSDSMLEERSRTLVRGVKYGESQEIVSYGAWTDYVETPIEPQDNLEIETVTQTVRSWSGNKSTTEKIVESDTVRLISTEKVSNGSTKSCPKGYTKKDGKCLSDLIRGDLTYLEYNSGKYLIENRPCEAIHTEKDSNGKYVYMYKNCRYREVTDMKTTSSSYKVYTYQEVEDRQVTLYRARVKYINTEKLPDTYTEEYFEEAKLPSGYVKLPGSEKIEYSYRLAVCEK